MAGERKVTDDELARLRHLHDEGWAIGDLAAEFGVTRQHVGRLVRQEQRPKVAGLDPDALSSSVTAAVDAFLAGIDLAGGDAVLAATARTLAGKLDGCQTADSAGAAHATARVAAGLVDVLERLRGRVPRELDEVDRLAQRRNARRLAAAAGVNGDTGKPAA